MVVTRTARALALFSAVVLVALLEGAAKANVEPPLGAGRYIVQFRDDKVANVDAAIAPLKAELGFEPFAAYRYAIKGFAAALEPEQVKALERNPLVLLVEPDQVGSTTAQTLSTGIRRIGGKLNGPARIDESASGSFGAFDVAVIDTGIDVDHPELTVPGGVRLSDSAFPNCNNGSNSFDDDAGHGTSVAGVIGAKDNTSATAGVAPGARTYAVKVLDNTGYGVFSCIILGVDRVTQRKQEYTVGIPGGINFRVANMSLGGASSSALCSAVNNSVLTGIVYVVAAGNSTVDAGNKSPANCSHVVTVSAIADYNGLPGGGAAQTCFGPVPYGSDDTLAAFSNFGSTVEVAGPGTCIATTAMGGGTRTDFAGTSAASPHVAGAAVLFLWNGYSGSTYGPTFFQAMMNQGWTIAQGSACGFTGDTDGYAEPLLWLAPGCATLTKIFSDVDCSGVVNNTDATKVLNYVAVLPVTQTEPCPDIGPAIKINGTLRKRGDVDCDGDVDSVDSLKIQQYVGGGNPSQNPGCPAFGSSVTIDVVGSL